MTTSQRLMILAAIIATASTLTLVRQARERQEASMASAGAPLEAQTAAAPLTPAAIAPHALNQPSILFGQGSIEGTRIAFPYLDEARLTDGRRFITFDARAAHAMEVGAMFEVPFPSPQEPGVVRVKNVSEFEGIHRMTGVFVGVESDEQRFSLTVAADATYATGQFQLGTQVAFMEANQGAGWLNDGRSDTAYLHENEHAALIHP